MCVEGGRERERREREERERERNTHVERDTERVEIWWLFWFSKSELKKKKESRLRSLLSDQGDMKGLQNFEKNVW